MPPGHYYSPLPGEQDFARYRVWRAQPLPDELPGISIDRATLRTSLEAIIDEYHSLPAFPPERRSDCRFFFKNPEIWYQDAIALRHFILASQPRRIIEVGCGHSSCCMLDVADAFNLKIDFTFIDPNPERLFEHIWRDDVSRCRIMTVPLQDVSLEEFDALEAGDILYIDSTHVSKLQSDVNWYMFEILPRLRPGVIIHIHDINFPFEWPEHLIERGWTEPYILRAFLTFNPYFKIIGWNAYFSLKMTEMVKRMPLCVEFPGGAFWMTRV
jgi:predicted O-methyltransferase YrrM